MSTVGFAELLRRDRPGPRRGRRRAQPVSLRDQLDAGALVRMMANHRAGTGRHVRYAELGDVEWGARLAFGSIVAIMAVAALGAFVAALGWVS